MAPSVSIVIPTYCLTTMLRNCLRSIRDAGGPPTEIIVVDDGSAPPYRDYLEVLRAQGLCDQVVFHTRNRGFAAACNSGLARARGAYLVLLNNDTWVHPGWLEALVECAEKDPSIGIVGAKLLFPNGFIYSAGCNMHGLRFEGHPGDLPEAARETDVVAVVGACMLIKREVVERIGAFDPEFYNAGEDIDLCLRARAHGYRIVYCPDAVVTHYDRWTRAHEWEETAALRNQMHNRLFARWQKTSPLWDDPPTLPTAEAAAAPVRARNEESAAGRLHVTYVIHVTAVTGGARVVLEHLNLLHQRGHDVALFALDRPPQWSKFEAPFQQFPSAEDLISALALRPGIKVATWWETAPWVLAACEQRGQPVYFVQDIESSYYMEDPRTQAQVMQSFSPRFHYLCGSAWIGEWVKRAFGYQTTVITPAIDHDCFHPRDVPRARDLICTLYRTLPLKNFQLTRSAFRQLRVPARMLCFGREAIAEPGIIWVPEPSDNQVAEIYSQATVFLLTSLHEGFGLPLLEAMACGCPVVTTDADSNMEFCRDGENCLLVPRHDAALVARVLERVLTDAGLQERLRRAGLETARRFNWEDRAAALESFYRSIVSGEEADGGER